MHLNKTTLALQGYKPNTYKTKIKKEEGSVLMKTIIVLISTIIQIAIVYKLSRFLTVVIVEKKKPIYVKNRIKCTFINYYKTILRIYNFIFTKSEA